MNGIRLPSLRGLVLTPTFAGRGRVAIIVFAVLLVAVVSLVFPETQGDSHQQSRFEQSAQLVQYRGEPSFDLTGAVIPRSEIRSGGPPKDAIPALTDPPALRAQDAGYLNGADRVVGVSLGDESRAYPLKILNYHEIVNDKLGGVTIAVTYCPLCDSVAVFDRRIAGGVREFGVSGLLYNSNVLMYDRGGRPESLWSQVGAQGVSGPGARTSLKALPVELTTWQDWQTRHPETTVLSDQTGHARNYQANPYRGYFARRGLMFPVRPINNRLPAKSPVLGVWSDGKARAYSLSAFGAPNILLKQELGGKKFNLVYDDQHKSLRVEQADEGLQWMYSFWFAWYAFRPDTEIYGSSP
jgi:uncharacterized protein DUF3179